MGAPNGSMSVVQNVARADMAIGVALAIVGAVTHRPVLAWVGLLLLGVGIGMFLFARKAVPPGGPGGA